jgi:hypothetical protein
VVVVGVDFHKLVVPVDLEEEVEAEEVLEQ